MVREGLCETIVATRAVMRRWRPERTVVGEDLLAPSSREHRRCFENCSRMHPRLARSWPRASHRREGLATAVRLDGGDGVSGRSMELGLSRNRRCARPLSAPPKMGKSSRHQSDVVELRIDQYVVAAGGRRYSKHHEIYSNDARRNSEPSYGNRSVGTVQPGK
jgi:hypothetical protein